MIKINKSNFKKFKVLVVGDSCVDRFVYGDVHRLAPEGPIPIFNPTSEISTPGMAGNVHRNLESIGCESIIISNKINPIKTRYVDERSGQLMIRVDESDKVNRIDSSLLRQIQKNNFLNNKIDAIVISDYNKGFLTEEDIKYICENNTNVFVDTKKFIGDWISNCSFIKINHVEYENVKKQIDKLGLQDKLIITLSSKGCKYSDKIFPVEFVQVKDVSGAGDTFLSGLVSEYIRTNSIEKAILFAQYCATIVVQKKGVSTI
jgi:D-beta-D-heptose 7-phosphate kinase/D-beta-D-heptose 1-phosphate adenosyltransferase